ncbi:hypothetical protein C9I98_07810 [Photobacterium sanctipauli]|uniref:DUF1496 domain-containing protein n=1 Tax=Photobacterium sanctipauli TaxID=1342794 RepID=A0A2T3NX06_9GAMM|nr:hypothetical protein [Photobacterium sanctipauli]PSW20738.1 hypothetical protein C9I98_07810 [Photobacterium sanctipauli]
MKKLLVALALVLPAFGVIASSSTSGSKSGQYSETYQVCYLDGKAVMLQRNMCYASGGSLVKPQ